jgi:hypothetical protein
VFTLQARDPDTDHNIHYFIVRDRSKYLVLAEYYYLIEFVCVDAGGRGYKAGFCGRLLAENVGSNPAGCMGVCLL